MSWGGRESVCPKLACARRKTIVGCSEMIWRALHDLYIYIYCVNTHSLNETRFKFLHNSQIEYDVEVKLRSIDSSCQVARISGSSLLSPYSGILTANTTYCVILLEYVKDSQLKQIVQFINLRGLNDDRRPSKVPVGCRILTRSIWHPCAVCSLASKFSKWLNAHDRRSRTLWHCSQRLASLEPNSSSIFQY